jgi:hypothetical protein
MRSKAAAGRPAAMQTKLYVIPTHPCRTAMLMLEHKGIPYRRVDLPAGVHPVALRLRGFQGNKRRFAVSITDLIGCSRSPTGWARCRRSCLTATG